MTACIQVKKHVPSGTIILQRPERRNALSRQVLEELQQAFQDLHQERRVRAVILTGGGPSFCSGLDLAEMKSAAEQPDAQALWYEDTILYRDLIETMLRFPKPIIAAVNGAAVAGGAGLCLAADLIVAGQGASFGFPEPKRGVVAGMVAPLMAFRVGGGWAANLLLTGRTIDAQQARQIGVFQEVVPDDHVWVRAHQLAEEISQSAPEAIQLTKRLLNESIGEHLFTLLSAGAAASATSRTTDAAAEGLQAFFEKRAPKWP